MPTRRRMNKAKQETDNGNRQCYIRNNICVSITLGKNIGTGQENALRSGWCLSGRLCCFCCPINREMWRKNEAREAKSISTGQWWRWMFCLLWIYFRKHTHGVHFRWWTGKHFLIWNQQLWTITRVIRISADIRRVNFNYNLFIYRWIVLNYADVNQSLHSFFLIPAFHFKDWLSRWRILKSVHQAHVPSCFKDFLIKYKMSLLSRPQNALFSK